MTSEGQGQGLLIRLVEVVIVSKGFKVFLRVPNNSMPGMFHNLKYVLTVSCYIKVLQSQCVLYS